MFNRNTSSFQPRIVEQVQRRQDFHQRSCVLYQRITEDCVGIAQSFFDLRYHLAQTLPTVLQRLALLVVDVTGDVGADGLNVLIVDVYAEVLRVWHRFETHTHIELATDHIRAWVFAGVVHGAEFEPSFLDECRVVLDELADEAVELGLHVAHLLGVLQKQFGRQHALAVIHPRQGN